MKVWTKVIATVNEIGNEMVGSKSKNGWNAGIRTKRLWKMDGLQLKGDTKNDSEGPLEQ